LSDLFDRAEAGLGEWLPQLAGAVAILALGLVLAWVVGNVTTRLLARVGLDRLAVRLGLYEAIGRPGHDPAVSLVVGRLVRIALALVVVVAAVSTLGIAGIQPSLNELLLYLPRLVAALALLVAGLIVGKLIGAWVDRLAGQLAVEAPLGKIACGLVTGVFVLTALAQLGIPTGLTIVLGAIVLVTIGVTAALAFGLGGRDVARELSAGRYVSSSFGLGQRVAVDSVEGVIVAFEPVALVVRQADGRIVRIPNHLLIESVVTTDAEPDE